MILYNLRCHKGHEFEAWFRDSGLCDRQLAAGQLRCPMCGADKLEKAIMAPRLTASHKDKSKAPPAPKAAAKPAGEQKAVQARKALLDLRQQIEDNCDYVGPAFAEEARKIHYGEAEERGIYGETSNEDADALVEEGIEVRQIPWLPRGDS